LNNITPAEAGNYVATLTVENCFTASTNPITISIEPIIETPIITAIDAVCIEGPLQLNIQNPTPNIRYDWYNEADQLISSTTESTLIISDNRTGQEAENYYVIANSTNCASAPSSMVEATLFPPTLNPAIAGDDQTTCAQSTAQLTAQTPTDGTGFWQDINQENTWPIPTPIVPLNLGTNIFIWTVQHPQCDISRKDTVFITNHDLPTTPAVAGNNQILCLDTTAFLNAIPSPSTIQGTWRSLGSATIENTNIANPPIHNLAIGENLFVWELSNTSCSVFSSDTVLINRALPPNEVATTGSDQTICEETTFELTAATPNQSQGQWTSLTNNNIQNPNNPNTPTQNLQEGDNTFIWTLSTDICPNFSSDTLTITTITPPEETAFAGIDQTICLEDTVSLAATSPNLATGNWQIPTTSTLDNPLTATTTLRNIAPGTHQLIWSLSYETCLNYDTDTLTITKISPPNEQAFAWQSANPLSIDNPTAFNSSISNLSAGNTYALVWSLSTNDCPHFSQDTVQIIIDSIPSVPAIIAREEFESTPSPTLPTMDLVLCDPNSILLKGNLPPNITGNWQTTNQVTLEKLSDSMAWITDIADQELQFVWSLSQNSCTNYSADTIDINLLTAEGLIAQADTFPLFFNESLQEIDLLQNDHIPDNMAWTFSVLTEGEGTLTDLGEGFVNYTPRTNFFGEDIVTYQLCHADCPELCSTANIHFQVQGSNADASCFVPNILTPNGDGRNDMFTVPCLPDYPTHELRIFNRWGDEVFAAAPYNNNWAGTHKFAPLPPGTYFYMIRLTDDPLDLLSGYFTLIR